MKNMVLGFTSLCFSHDDIDFKKKKKKKIQPCYLP